jgi:two-component system LytT family response regulator
MNKTIRCIIVDDEAIAREILENHLAKVDSVQVVASCKNALEAFKVINQQPVDLVFLDINMPEISGLSFAKSMTKQIKVIFTTAYREYAVDGFDLKAVDYLLKPISFERLLQSINKYFDENTPSIASESPNLDVENNDSLFVRSDRKMIRINFSDVKYVESISDYIKIHLKDKTVVTRETLSNIEAKLPHKDFLRIHRSFIVAISGIDSFTSEYVEVGSKQLPISRSYKDEVIGRLEGK